MKYKYVPTPEGNIKKLKARFSIRGVLTKPKIHYDPHHTGAYAIDKNTQRKIYALAATRGHPLLHLNPHLQQKNINTTARYTPVNSRKFTPHKPTSINQSDTCVSTYTTRMKRATSTKMDWTEIYEHITSHLHRPTREFTSNTPTTAQRSHSAPSTNSSPWSPHRCSSQSSKVSYKPSTESPTSDALRHISAGKPSAMQTE